MITILTGVCLIAFAVIARAKRMRGYRLIFNFCWPIGILTTVLGFLVGGGSKSGFVDGFEIITAAVVVVFIIIACVYIYRFWVFNSTTYHAITGNGYFKTKHDKGLWGEYQIYKELEDLETRRCRFLFNLYVPRQQGGTAEIDVILISPIGLIVFESKNYAGWVFGDERFKTWTQTLPAGKRVEKSSFYNPIWQNRMHINEITAYLGAPGPTVSVIVFSNNCELRDVHWTSEDVFVIARNHLRETIDGLFAYEEVLTDYQIDTLYELLLPLTNASDEVKRQHIEIIRQKHRR